MRLSQRPHHHQPPCRLPIAPFTTSPPMHFSPRGFVALSSPRGQRYSYPQPPPTISSSLQQNYRDYKLFSSFPQPPHPLYHSQMSAPASALVLYRRVLRSLRQFDDPGKKWYVHAWEFVGGSKRGSWLACALSGRRSREEPVWTLLLLRRQMLHPPFQQNVYAWDFCVWKRKRVIGWQVLCSKRTTGPEGQRA